MFRSSGIIVLAIVLLVGCSDDSSDDSTSPMSSDLNDYSKWLVDDGSKSPLLEPCRNATEDNCVYGTLEDSRDGQVYKTVKVGNQVWMAENLNFASKHSFCSKAEGCKGVGRLYAKDVIYDTLTEPCMSPNECKAVMPVQGVCPDGWHVSTSSEWDNLFSAIGGKIAPRLLMKDGAWALEVRDYQDAFGLALIPTPSQEGDGVGRSFLHSEYPDDVGPYKNESFSDVYELDRSGLGVSVSAFSFFISLGVGIRCVQNEAGAVGTVSHMEPVSGELYDRDVFNPNIPYGELVDSRDGKVYKTVVIGTQTWMAQNLNFDTGDTLSKCFDDSEAFCDKFGRLYYKEMSMKTDICPIGWHVPSVEEMRTLLNMTCMDSVDKTMHYEHLMAEGLWSFHVYPEREVLAKNEFGFSLLPSINLYTQSSLWESNGDALTIMEHNYNARLSDKRASIRCIMDAAAPTTEN